MRIGIFLKYRYSDYSLHSLHSHGKYEFDRHELTCDRLYKQAIDDGLEACDIRGDSVSSLNISAGYGFSELSIELRCLRKEFAT